MNRSTTTGGREATTAVIPGGGIISVGDPETSTPPGYRWTPLSSCARLESGHTPSRSREEYWDGGIPWIGIKDATAHHGEIIGTTFQHVSQLGVDNSSTRLLPPNTVCLSRTASVGYVVQTAVPMCTSQDFVNWVCNETLNPNYLRFALVAESESVRRWATGSTHKTLYFPEAKAIHVLLPARRIQDAIAEVLGALDDKIAANRRVVASADKLGRLLAHREARTGEEVALESVAELLTRGTAPKYADSGHLVLNQKCVRNGRVDIRLARTMSSLPKASEKVLRYGDVLVNSTGQGTLGRTARWTFESQSVSVDTHISIVRVDSSTADRDYVGTLMLDRESDIEALAEGTTGQTELRRQALGSLPLQLPPLDVQRRVGEQLRTMARLMDAKEFENQRLAATRDELLPLLMSGKITVKDAENRIEEAE